MWRDGNIVERAFGRRNSRFEKMLLDPATVGYTHFMNETDSETPASNTAGIAADLAAIQPRLYGFILKRLADRDQTLEVLQRTNLVICQKSVEFEAGSSFVAWAFTIARFQVMAWRKTQAGGRLVFTDAVYDLLDRSPEAEADAVDRRIPLLRQCVEKLGEPDRHLVQHRYRDGEPTRSIADRLEKSVDAVAMRLMRIRRQLADCVSTALESFDGKPGQVS